jgi:hypothetical protein
MTEYLSLIKKSQIEADYMPNVEKVLIHSVDPVTADEIRIKVAKMSGKILD